MNFDRVILRGYILFLFFPAGVVKLLRAMGFKQLTNCVMRILTDRVRHRRSNFRNSYSVSKQCNFRNIATTSICASGEPGGSTKQPPGLNTAFGLPASQDLIGQASTRSPRKGIFPCIGACPHCLRLQALQAGPSLGGGTDGAKLEYVQKHYARHYTGKGDYIFCILTDPPLIASLSAGGQAKNLSTFLPATPESSMEGGCFQGNYYQKRKDLQQDLRLHPPAAPLLAATWFIPQISKIVIIPHAYRRKQCGQGKPVKQYYIYPC
ncbi:hypothetical protein AKJ60_00385 [candidate division MSBL1 archaeon SCGC-AAA385M11]|nr:hypothetical protein AKJ60_00385 [candidate division MSBL1 archaeon SCGC-AAA385M11]